MRGYKKNKLILIEIHREDIRDLPDILGIQIICTIFWSGSLQ